MNYKKFLPDVLMIALFVVISVMYFWNPIIDGLVLTGTDHNAAVGSNVELNEYRKAHNGERTRWTNSLFSGMPTYQMSPSYNSTDTLSTIETIYQLGLPTVAAYVFMMLLGFYILLRAFDFRAWMAALGAILWAFSSYYFIIIAAGHIWKLLTLSFIPPTIAGMVLCYRGKYLWGIVVTGIFTALQILSNHIQMSYYFLPVMALMALAFLVGGVWRVESGERNVISSWLKGTLAAIIGGLLGVSINISNLYHTYEYSKETMRGKSELTQKTKNAEDQTSSGLERSYITAWSYGIDETWTLLVPNTKGGASMPLTQSEKAMEKANNQYRPLYQQLGQYWGDQPGTSGPVYVGAFVLFLFVLGLFIVKGPMKWALLIATILSILLSWGRNFMPLTDFFLDYVPMYDKFRTVASILVIAEFTIPLLAMFALKEIVERNEKRETGNENNVSSRFSPLASTPLYIALALTAGICFLFWLMPDVFFGNYISLSESSALQGLVDSGVSQATVNDILENLNDMRRAVFTADAMRSCIIILVGFGILMLYRYRKLKEVPMVVCLALLCLVDMWSVNKRYLSDDDFVRPRTDVQAFPMSEADMEILQDSDAYYRVLNLSVNTFNDNTTSYYHKSIGGYHAAKLRRYQELIEEHIQAQIDRAFDAAAQGGGYLDQCNGDSLFPVLNMLNMKYMILPLKDNNKISVLNPHANGNAWFVDKVHYVEDADAELKALHGLDTKHEAVADKRFEPILSPSPRSPHGEEGRASLSSYEANELQYDVESNAGGVLVFSEIYYPGWTCTVDGQPVEIGRVDYVLRAIHIDGGKHHVVLTFKPRSERITESIAYSALGLLALVFIGLLIRLFITHKKQNKS